MQNLDLAAAVAATVARRDPHRLSEAVTETVRLRALLPGGPVESHGRADVAARFHAWFADFDTVEVLDSAGEGGAGARPLPHPPRGGAGARPASGPPPAAGGAGPGAGGSAGSRGSEGSSGGAGR